MYALSPSENMNNIFLIKRLAIEILKFPKCMCVLSAFQKNVKRNITETPQIIVYSLQCACGSQLSWEHWHIKMWNKFETCKWWIPAHQQRRSVSVQLLHTPFDFRKFFSKLVHKIIRHFHSPNVNEHLLLEAFYLHFIAMVHSLRPADYSVSVLLARSAAYTSPQLESYHEKVCEKLMKKNGMQWFSIWRHSPSYIQIITCCGHEHRAYLRITNFVELETLSPRGRNTKRFDKVTLFVSSVTQAASTRLNVNYHHLCIISFIPHARQVI